VTFRDWISVVASIGQLAVAVIAVSHRRPSALKAPLAALCLDISLWTAASSTQHTVYRTLALGVDRAFSPLTAPLALDFVLVFVGVRRSSHLVRVAAFLLAGSLSVVALLTSEVPEWHPFLGSRAWNVWLLASSIPTMIVALLALARHSRKTIDPEERARANLLLAVFGLGTAFGITDPIGELVPRCPPLADIGMLICALGMAVVTIQFRLLGSRTSRRTVLVLGAAALLTFTICFVALGLAGMIGIPVVLVTIAISIATLATVHSRVIAARAHSDRTGQLVSLGRLAAQMDHDVRNPLAALKGAAKLLERDLVRPEAKIDRLDFVNLIISQVERIEALFGRYRKLSSLELDCADIQVNDVVRAVLRRQGAAVPDTVVVHDQLDSSLPRCLVDPDLLATVVENLTRNAMEAMPEGGVLTVATAEGPGSRPGIEISVSDTGMGMDARTREMATDDFFTTKAGGCGLGLAFTKRVVSAHAGRLTIESTIGRGTRVMVWIPQKRTRADDPHDGCAASGQSKA
jgi:signal transduction histidine kinase